MNIATRINDIIAMANQQVKSPRAVQSRPGQQGPSVDPGPAADVKVSGVPSSGLDPEPSAPAQ